MTHLDLGAIARRLIAFQLPIAAESVPIAADQVPTAVNGVLNAADEFAFERAIPAYEELIDITVGATVGTIVEIKLKPAAAGRLR